MRNYNYYVAVDENGQPYIAHGVFSNIGNRIKNSKYYQKIKTSYGWRYFYDPEEWKAYVNGGKDAAAPKSLVGRVKDKLGFDERARAQQATGSQATEAQAEYERTALGRAEKTVGQFKDKATRMREEFQKKNKAQYSDYNENDPDFNDGNYTEDRRVGQTDFFMFKGNNGRTVILEEDMKWTLPKDIDPNSPEIRAALEKASDLPGGTWEEWAKNVSSILDEAIKVARNK